MEASAMTVREVATYLNVDEKTIYRLAKRGEIPGFKVAGTWRFKKGDIDAWIEARKADATSDAREDDAPPGGARRPR